MHLHTLLGEDASGRRVETELANAGVHLHTDPDAGPTEQHVNLMAADGSRLSVYRSVTTPRPDLDLTRLVGLAADCDAVVLNITDYVRRLVAPLRKSGIPFWTDLHDWDGRNPYHRDFADAAASVVLSDDALPDPVPVSEELARGGRLVVCTRGARGAMAWADGTTPRRRRLAGRRGRRHQRRRRCLQRGADSRPGPRLAARAGTAGGGGRRGHGGDERVARLAAADRGPARQRDSDRHDGRTTTVEQRRDHWSSPDRRRRDRCERSR